MDNGPGLLQRTDKPFTEEAEHYYAQYCDADLRKSKSGFPMWLAAKLFLEGNGFIEEPEPSPETAGSATPSNATQSRAARAKIERHRRARMICMADVERRVQKWLWRDRIPADTFSMIVGIPGDGKSSLAYMIAARVSAGGRWPDCRDDEIEQGSVVILQRENGLATIVQKRLEDAGADLSRIHILECIEESDGNGGFRASGFSLARDLEILEEEVRRLKDVRLVIVDPIASFLNGAEENKSGDVRDMVDPIFAFTERYQLAFLAVGHLTKGYGTNILNRIIGSVSFGASARMIWYVSRHPQDRTKRVLSFVKGNLTDGDPKAMTYQYVGGVHQFDAKPSEWVADDVARLLADGAQIARDEWGSKRGPVPGASARAAELVITMLKEGPRPKLECQDQAEESGIKESSFHKGVNHLLRHGRILSKRRDGDKRLWLEINPEVQELPLGGPENAPQTGV